MALAQGLEPQAQLFQVVFVLVEALGLFISYPLKEPFSFYCSYWHQITQPPSHANVPFLALLGIK